jgi:hypothetical protein
VKSLVAQLWSYQGEKSEWSGKGVIPDNIDLQAALNQTGVKPDVSFPENTPLLWIHRRLRDTEIYFLTNQSENKINFEAEFRVDDKQPELWDPMDGMIRDLPVCFQKDGRITVPLQLDTFGSAFIVFRKKGEAPTNNPETNYPDPVTIVQITNPWEVVFDRLKGGPENGVTMVSLEDWSKNQDERIRYYSGSAVYSNIFNLKEVPMDSRLFIDLGKVSVMAEVRINGKKAGGVWTSPWKVNITDLVKQGENNVEVEVVNNWINRLIGDSQLPQDKRTTWVNENPARPGDPLQPSGLMGPVTIESRKY